MLHAEITEKVNALTPRELSRLRMACLMYQHSMTHNPPEAEHFRRRVTLVLQHDTHNIGAILDVLDRLF